MVTEKQVLEIWLHTLQNRSDLKTATNEPLTIVYPGRRNDDRGADFKDAIIATGGGRLKGDIEIHVKASHWWAHRHHHDPAYNRVILHVVYQNDTAKSLVLANGFKVPTLALCDYDGNNNSASASPLPCRGIGYRRNTILIARLLDGAGKARFLSRAALFRETIARSGAGQALYQGIMTALGYSKNKEAMAELAGRMPLLQLEAITSNVVSDSDFLARCQALLMGAAGLLPSQHPGIQPISGYIEDWEAELEISWDDAHLAVCMSAKDWHFFKVRPANLPVRRIAAMSYLLLRYRQAGLLAGLEDRLKEAAADNEVCSLEQALAVAPDSYWGCFLDFGLPAAGTVPALLGQERAADIVVNVLLPFAFIRGTSESSEKALNIYHDYRASEENSLVTHMRQQLGVSRYLVNTACRQQGLIHIYKTHCLEGRCDECPLNNISD
jgi:hypothetical protein